jgi:hypothetical protein
VELKPVRPTAEAPAERFTGDVCTGDGCTPRSAALTRSAQPPVLGAGVSAASTSATSAAAAAARQTIV